MYKPRCPVLAFKLEYSPCSLKSQARSKWVQLKVTKQNNIFAMLSIKKKKKIPKQSELILLLYHSLAFSEVQNHVYNHKAQLRR